MHASFACCSLDQLVPSAGHCATNVLPSCRRCNVAHGTITLTEEVAIREEADEGWKPHMLGCALPNIVACICGTAQMQAKSLRLV